MLNLPTYAGTIEPFASTREPLVPRAPSRPWTRVAFAAAHVVSDPMAERSPWTGRPAVDWDATLNFRRGLWDQGLGLAEAMDTAQRGMGVDWDTARQLIARTMTEAKAHPLKPRVASGAGTDHKTLAELPDLDSIIAAYEHQMAAIEAEGGQLILMATRALPAIGATPDDYIKVYNRLISQAKDPVILHWLGDMFDPALKGYWGHDSIAAASDAVLDLMRAHPGQVDGIKISLLDQAHEEAFRARLPEGVKLYTGDDFNYAALIAGDDAHYSHALLGAFTAIAPAAAQALDALAAGDRAGYDALMDPTVPFSRELFRAPTQFYKAGIAFLAWLNGAQAHFIMPAGFQSTRSITHYAELYRLAADAGLLQNPDLAEARMRHLLAVYGIGA